MVWDGQCLRSLWNWHCRTAGPLMGCWTPKKGYHLFYEAKKSQVMAALPQNTATKASHVVKLPGGGTPNPGLQRKIFRTPAFCQYTCGHMHKYLEQDHALVSKIT